VFVASEMAGGSVVGVAAGSAAGSWGSWSGVRRERAAPPSAGEPPGRGRALDLRVPASIREAVGVEGEGALALQGSAITVFPVEWERVAGGYRAQVPGAARDLAHAILGRRAGRAVRGALTVDQASTWRAADMVGMLLQG